MAADSYASNVPESKKSFQYLAYVFTVPVEVYSTKAAEEFDVQQSRAAKVLKDLESIGALYSEKSGRKRVYKLDEEGIVDLWYELWFKHSTKDSVDELRDFMAENIQISEFEDLIVNYVKSYLYSAYNNNIESTIEEMLVYRFAQDFSRFVEHENIHVAEAKEWHEKQAFFLSDMLSGGANHVNFIAQALQNMEDE